MPHDLRLNRYLMCIFLSLLFYFPVIHYSSLKLLVHVSSKNWLSKINSFSYYFFEKLFITINPFSFVWSYLVNIWIHDHSVLGILGRVKDFIYPPSTLCERIEENNIPHLLLFIYNHLERCFLKIIYICFKHPSKWIRVREKEN